MVTITKLRAKDFFKVNKKYVKIKEGAPTLSVGEPLNEVELKSIQDFYKKLESGLKISKTVTT